MPVPAPQPPPSFDPLSAHEDRLVRLEDALLESAKQTAELSGCMRSFEGKLEVLMDSLKTNLDGLGVKMNSGEAALAETMRRLEALEIRKASEVQARARWIDIAQKIGIYAVTAGGSAVAGWMARVMMTP